MVNYTVIKKIATIHQWQNTTLELNVVKWGTGKPKYDLRRWTNNEPQKGITLEDEDLSKLFYLIGAEIGYDFNHQEEYDDEDKEEYEEDEEEIDYRSFFVHGDMRYCEDHGHDYRKIMAQIPIFTKEKKVQNIEFSAYHCYDCGAYYISEALYGRIRAKGRLLCQLVSKAEFEDIKRNKTFDDLNPQGKLAIIGYNVGSKDNFSAKYRQTILEYAIKGGVVTKKEAISYLRFFIKLNEDRPNMKSAVQKWKEDLNFLMGRPASEERLVGVARIVRK